MSPQSTKNSRSGKAVVTGASAGIGRIYAQRLAARGYDLVLIARRADRLDALAVDLRAQHGVAVETVTADLSALGDLDRVAHIIESDDSINLLVNCAGLWLCKPVAETSVADITAMIAVNVLALARLSRAALPGFIARDSGTLINVGSVMGFHPLPDSTVYSGTKGFILQFTLGLQAEVAGTNVRIQLVTPAATDTEMWDIAGLPISHVDAAIVMTPEQCVDAALAGLDLGESLTQPSLEDTRLQAIYDEARLKMFHAGQIGKPASRYVKNIAP